MKKIHYYLLFSLPQFYNLLFIFFNYFFKSSNFGSKSYGNLYYISFYSYNNYLTLVLFSKNYFTYSF